MTQLSAIIKRILALIGILCISTLSGYIGGIFAQQIPTFEDIGTKPLIIEESPLAKTERSLESLYKHINPLVVKIVALDKRGFPVAGSVSYGTILTSDGWIVTSSRSDDPKTSLRAILPDGSFIKVGERKHDSAAAVDYFHIDANGLPTVDFLSDDEQFEAREVTAYTPQQGMMRMAIVRKWYAASAGGDVRSSDTLQKSYPLIGQELENGIPVFTSQGKLAGIVHSAAITPSIYIQDGIKRLLKTRSLERITLAIPYRDLAFTDLGEQKGKNGALVTTDKPVVLRGQKDKEIVYDGDIITKVNDEDINENQSLSELLMGYSKDDAVTLRVQRKQGKEDLLTVRSN